MERIRFSDKQLADMIMRLNGEIEPIGETNIDEERFANLIRLQNTLDILLDEISYLLPYQKRPEFSIKRAGLQASYWLEEKYEWINECISEFYPKEET